MILIGLTGSFGSGCSKIAKEFLVPKEFKYYSLSKALKDYYEKEKVKDEAPDRTALQDFGNSLREQHGNDFLAKRICNEIEADQGEKVVIDSIRNPGEVKYLKEKFPLFFLFGIYADADIRWERVKDTYNGDKGKFEIDDKRDAGESFDYGQRVRDCYLMSDIIIANNEEIQRNNRAKQLMDGKREKYISLIKKEREFPPSEMETIMAMAYANSLRSSCLKRKVGAVIIDNSGNIFSSGYNEVPPNEAPCLERWGGCYRTHLREEITEELKKITGDVIIISEMNTFLKKRFKILDHCRALHAEENAIINVARFGSSAALKDATIYTTTYPCNLCANKIVKVGIKKVIYLEPYPQKEARELISKGNITQEPFEGILFNGYFRLFWR